MENLGDELELLTLDVLNKSEKLNKTLNDEQKEKLEEFCEASSKVNSAMETEAFKRGFMITKRSNASLTCGRTTCKKERLYKANDDYKKRAMADPIKEAYLNFDNKCRSYRKKLSGYPDLLEKYNKAFDERREKIRAFKGGLTVNSSTKDIDRYNQMCFDACQDLQDFSKRLKAKIDKST